MAGNIKLQCCEDLKPVGFEVPIAHAARKDARVCHATRVEGNVDGVINGCWWGGVGWRGGMLAWWATRQRVLCKAWVGSFLCFSAFHQPSHFGATAAVVLLQDRVLAGRQRSTAGGAGCREAVHCRHGYEFNYRHVGAQRIWLCLHGWGK